MMSDCADAQALFCRRRPGREGPPARPDLMSATRWARTADFYDTMDRDIIYPNLSIY